MAKKAGPGNPVGRPKLGGVDSRSPGTRQRALSAAQRLLGARGYGGILLDDVAREAGITRASLYHHFPGGKGDLMLAVSHHVLDEGQSAFAQITGSGLPVRQQLGALAAWLFAREDQPERLVREAVPHLPPEHARQVYTRFMTEMHAPIVATLTAGIQSGELPLHDPVFATWVFLSLVAGLPGASTSHTTGQTPEQTPEQMPEQAPQLLSARVVDWFLHGLTGQQDSLP